MQFILDNILPIILLLGGGGYYMFKDQVVSKLKGLKLSPSKNENLLISDLDILLNMREKYKDTLYNEFTSVINGIINPSTLLTQRNER